MNYRFRDRFALSVSANYFDVRLDEGSFTTALYRLAGSYSFTPRLYLQANVQYSDDTENLGANIRLGWLDTAGTGLFIVYNERQSMDATGVSGLWPRRALETPERTLAVKFTRQFDLSGFADMGLD